MRKFVVVPVLNGTKAVRMVWAFVISTGEFGLSVDLPEVKERFLVDTCWHVFRFASQKEQYHILVPLAYLTEIGGVVLQLVGMMFFSEVNLGKKVLGV